MEKNIIAEITALYKKLTVPQKVIIGGAVVATIILLGTLLMILNEPEYSTLFTNLQEEDAGKVIEYLNTEQIAYQIGDDGRTIKVPKEIVYETRLGLSGKGIPGSGIVGYEIFDKNTMGMSEFMQKLNFKRAIEGELSRTIIQQEGIEGARVHIVMPEKSVFRDEEKIPTASVLLKLAGAYNLPQPKINAIVNLVSSSVEGLLPQNVTVLDSKGHLLSKESNENPLTAASSTQYELKQSVESYLAKKAQSILDNVLGYGNGMVKIDVDLNFDQVEKTMEIYDPDSQVAISEQVVKSDNLNRGFGDSTATASENSILNYEINKTVQRVIEGTGTIKRLSVAAVINDVLETNEQAGEMVTVYTPRPQNQLIKLQQIISNAVGIDPSRNDQFSIVNIPFETKLYEVNEINSYDNSTPIYQDYDKLINLLFIFIAIGASLYIVKRLLTKVQAERILSGNVSDGPKLAYQGAGKGNALNQDYFEKTGQNKLESGASKEGGEGTKQLPEKKPVRSILGSIEEEISHDAIAKKEKQEKIANYVSENPVDAAKLIHAWLYEDEY